MRDCKNDININFFANIWEDKMATNHIPDDLSQTVYETCVCEQNTTVLSDVWLLNFRTKLILEGF